MCYEHFLLNYLKGQLALMLDNLDDEHTKRPNWKTSLAEQILGVWLPYTITSWLLCCAIYSELGKLSLSLLVIQIMGSSGELVVLLNAAQDSKKASLRNESFFITNQGRKVGVGGPGGHKFCADCLNRGEGRRLCLPHYYVSFRIFRPSYGTAN